MVWKPFFGSFGLGVFDVICSCCFYYEATSSKKNRSITKELITGAVTSIFLGFGSLLLLLATGVYV
ncbi:hypothetical protein MKX01_018818 [Papaver californicum]|nr:hypothetical protein MKX01_018818 [Papaver californicum]